MTRRLLVVALLATSIIPITAAPASAHSNYCGHGTSGNHWYPWRHRVEFQQHYRGADGSHQHIVIRRGTFETRANYWLTCNHR